MAARTVTAFAELGVMAWEEDRFPDALLELSLRLDLAGAGPLLDQLIATCWGPDAANCPHCALDAKPNPQPHPRPEPTPPPPPPGEGQ